MRFRELHHPEAARPITVTHPVRGAIPGPPNELSSMPQKKRASRTKPRPPSFFATGSGESTNHSEMLEAIRRKAGFVPLSAEASEGIRDGSMLPSTHASRDGPHRIRLCGSLAYAPFPCGLRIPPYCHHQDTHAAARQAEQVTFALSLI